MNVNRRLAASGLLALATVALAPAGSARAWTYQYMGFPCNSNPVRLGGHRAMTPRCAGGGNVSLQTGAFADRAEVSWREWWDLNNANHSVWVRRDTCTSTFSWGGCDGQNKARASSGAFSWGQAQWCASCAVNGTPYINEVDAEVNSSTNDPLPSQCAHGGWTFAGTWVHEIGHTYGFDHFDDWLSTMNSVAPDVTSCLPSRLVRPSSDAQQGYGALYGMPAAYDYGSTPMVQTGSLAMGNWSLPNFTITYARSFSGTSDVQLDLTRMNMRSAWPNATIFYRVFLSTDAVLSSDDVFVTEQSVNTGLFAGAIYRFQPTVTIAPSVHLAPGQEKCFIVQWDTAAPVAEAREDDNVMDTKICVRRNP